MVRPESAFRRSGLPHMSEVCCELGLVEFCSQISYPRASHCRRARRGWCAALSSTLSQPSPRGAGGGLGKDDEAVDVVVPLPHHIRRGRQIWRFAEQLPGRGYRLARSGLHGGFGGMLRFTLLRAVGSSPRRWTARGLRRGCRRVLPHRGGHGTRQSEPWRCQVGDQVETKLPPYLTRQMSEDFSSRVADCTRLILSAG